MSAEQNVNHSALIIFLTVQFSSPLAPGAEIAVRPRPDMLLSKSFTK
jgi:hypothetical protein